MKNEATIRPGIFLVLFCLFALAEALLPRTARTQPRSSRCLTNCQ